MSARIPRRNGKTASPVGGTLSKDRDTTPDKLRELLAATFNIYQGGGDRKLKARRRRNFAFHMTDWSDDLRRLADLYRRPEAFDKEEAGQIVCGFLYHVIPHLRAAGRLLLDYEPEDFFRELDSQSG